jgi:hypothetical protein
MISRCLVWAFAVFFAFDLTFAAKEKEELPAPPPMPQSETVAMYRGRTVTITLRAIGRAPGQLRFLIRKKPRYGTLGEITPIDRKKATVTYTHDARNGAGMDTFSFAVQAPDSAVSAQGVVTIAISEEPPAFSVVHALDFGTVLLGDRKEEEIVIKNVGGGILSGRITAPPSWKINGPTTYQLKRHEEQKVQIVFEPSQPLEFVEKLQFSHDARTAVTLSGTGAAPLAFTPEKEIELQAESGEARRTATLLVQNLTDQPRPLEVQPPENIIEPAEVTIPPKGEARITLVTKPDFIEQIDGSVNIISEGYRTEIPLRAYALQPSLQVTPSTGFDFGEVQPGHRYKGVLQLKNTGGLAARITTDLPSGLLLTPDPESVVITSGETRAFEFTFEPMATGDLKHEIVLNVAHGDTVRIPVRATSVAPPEAARPTPTPSRQPASVENPPKGAEPPAPPASDIPAIANIMVLDITSSSVDLGWKKPAENARGTLVEFREIEATTDGPPKTKWTEWRGAKFLEENGLSVARFEALPPGRTWYIRISSIDEAGKRSAPSQTVRLAARPAKKSPWLLIVVGVVVVSGIGGVVWFVRLRRQQMENEEAQRISTLEKS